MTVKKLEERVRGASDETIYEALKELREVLKIVLEIETPENLILKDSYDKRKQLGEFSLEILEDYENDQIRYFILDDILNEYNSKNVEVSKKEIGKWIRRSLHKHLSFRPKKRGISPSEKTGKALANYESFIINPLFETLHNYYGRE